MAWHKTNKINHNRINQGDIFKNVPYLESYKEINNNFEMNMKIFPYVMVMTQDCDLEQNSKNTTEFKVNKDPEKKLDKFLISIIVLPIYNSEQLFIGEHLSNLKSHNINIKTEKINSDRKNIIKSNNNPRYHYIDFGEETLLPTSVIDFKHLFSISLSWLEENKDNKICTIDELYREYISQRFCSFLSRIGLPERENKTKI